MEAARPTAAALGARKRAHRPANHRRQHTRRGVLRRSIPRRWIADIWRKAQLAESGALRPAGQIGQMPTHRPPGWVMSDATRTSPRGPRPSYRVRPAVAAGLRELAASERA